MGCHTPALGRAMAMLPSASSLATLSADAILDTDLTTELQEKSDSFKSYLGLTPEGTAGEVAENITNFTVGFIPVAGWLGRAGQVARGSQTLAFKKLSLSSRPVT